MLERQRLLLRPWVAGPQAPPNGTSACTRTICDADTHEYLGHAGWWPGSPPAWFPWLARPLFKVFETEDAALVFSVARVWGLGARWRIADADEHPVGTLCYRGASWLADTTPAGAGGPRRAGPTAETLFEDPLGHCFASLGPPLDGTPLRFRATHGPELGVLADAKEGKLLTFGPAVEPYPFAKMLLLAAALQR